MTSKEFLEHFGILGMRWGRKRRTSKSKPMFEDRRSIDHLTKLDLAKKKVSEMTNDEIRTLTTRLQLERSHKDLTKQSMSAGKKFLIDQLTSIGKTQLEKVVAQGSAKLMEKILTKGK